MSKVRIHRAFGQVGARRVHYRHAGAGAPLLMVHQSPKSSTEFEDLMQRWGETHLVIAPDTPGFGQSDPLANSDATVTDFAAALIAFMDTIGLHQTPVYGYHSGAVFAVEAAKLAPARFTAVACNAYALWLPDEIAAFENGYLPPFVPCPFGAHLTWLWARMREQRFFFPWYATDDVHRIALPLADAAHVHASAMDMLYAGDAYRVGYGAVVRAQRDFPDEAHAVPTLIAAADTDPLQSHLDRLHGMPSTWQARKVATVADVEARALAFLGSHPAAAMVLPDATTAPDVFVAIDLGDIAVRRRADSRGCYQRLVLHAPGASNRGLILEAGDIAVDLPGHGLTSARFTSLDGACALIHRVVGPMVSTPVEIVGHGLSAALALHYAQAFAAQVRAVEIVDGAWPQPTDLAEWRAHYVADCTPHEDGFHLLRAWRRVRDAQLFWPWFSNQTRDAIPVNPAHLDAAELAARHLAVLQAVDEPAYVAACLAQDIAQLCARCPVPIRWHAPAWANHRTDVWTLTGETT